VDLLLYRTANSGIFGLISRISGPCTNRFYLLFTFSFR